MNRNNKIKVFYNPKEVCKDNIQEESYSKSPLKPMLLMQYLQDNGFSNHLEIDSSFAPFGRKDFRLAHHKRYVKNFFAGTGNCRSNSLPWSENLVESVTYTNSSIYNAIKYAVDNPETITFSPTSGFHHAQPQGGSGFCTFSGQVIAATKIYRETGKRAAFLDLDGHFGNSIEDSRNFVEDLDKSIPFNINPVHSHQVYVDDFTLWLSELTKAFVDGAVDYVVWCHGADSHEWDQLGHQCSTEEWLKCSKLFYGWVKDMQDTYDITVPVTLALFGGYRDDDYNSVLSLHTSDLQICLSALCGVDVEYTTQVQPKPIRTFYRSSFVNVDDSDVDLVETHYGIDNDDDDDDDDDKWWEPSELQRAVDIDAFGLREMTAPKIVDEIALSTGTTINIDVKDKKRIIKEGYRLLIQCNYV